MSTLVYNIIVLEWLGNNGVKNVRMTGISSFTIADSNYYQLSSIYILKAIKNTTGTSVIFPINISLIHFVFVLTSIPKVREGFTKT